MRLSVGVTFLFLVLVQGNSYLDFTGASNPLDYPVIESDALLQAFPNQAFHPPTIACADQTQCITIGTGYTTTGVVLFPSTGWGIQIYSALVGMVASATADITAYVTCDRGATQSQTATSAPTIGFPAAKLTFTANNYGVMFCNVTFTASSHASQAGMNYFEYSITDVNECSTPGTCASGYVCVNSPGSYQCNDVNECATSNGGCGSDAYVTCTNSAGSYTCTDIDLCALGTPTCDAYHTCVNHHNGASTCNDINECTTAPCDAGFTCENLQGSPGYQCLDSASYMPTQVANLQADVDAIFVGLDNLLAQNASIYNLFNSLTSRINTLQATVTSQGATITSQGSSITALQGTVTWLTTVVTTLQAQMKIAMNTALLDNIGALSVGSQNATSVTVGKSSITTTINSNIFSLPNRVAFIVSRTTSTGSVTGDSSAYVVKFNSVSTQLGGTNYNTGTGVFTAPTGGAGIYLFTAVITVYGIVPGSHTVYYAWIGGGLVNQENPSTANSGALTIKATTTIYMNAGDTVSVTIAIGGGSKVCTIDYASGHTYFTGTLLG